jgi:hypothetical protein
MCNLALVNLVRLIATRLEKQLKAKTSHVYDVNGLGLWHVAYASFIRLNILYFLKKEIKTETRKTGM